MQPAREDVGCKGGVEDAGHHGQKERQHQGLDAGKAKHPGQDPSGKAQHREEKRGREEHGEQELTNTDPGQRRGGAGSPIQQKWGGQIIVRMVDCRASAYPLMV